MPKTKRARFAPLPKQKIPGLLKELSHGEQARRSSALHELLLFEPKHLLPHFDGFIRSLKQNAASKPEATQLVWKTSKRLSKKPLQQEGNELILATGFFHPAKNPMEFAQIYSEMRHNGLSNASTPKEPMEHWRTRALALKGFASKKASGK